MDKHSELIRRAQAGDPDAVKALIERNQSIVYRLALSIMDDSTKAAEVAKETLITALSGLEAYSGMVAFPTWLYSITVGVCRDRLRRQRIVRRLPARLRALFQHSPLQANTPDGEPPAERHSRLVWLAGRMDDRLRLPLILRYDQALSVQEMSPMLDMRERTIHANLMTARAQLRAGLDEEVGKDELGDPLHQRAHRLIDAAADRLITDADNKWLEDHLRECAACKAWAQRVTMLETDISTAFHQSWDDCPVPAADFSLAVQDHRRLRTAGRHTLNLIGALTVGLVAIGVVIFLPSLSPADSVPLQPMAAPTATPSPRNAFRSFLRPTPVSLPNNPDLLTAIYPGRLAYVDMTFNFRPMGDHLFTMLPNGGNVNQLTFELTQNSSPIWSPDGSEIAFLAVPPNDGQNEVYVVNADGTNLQQVSTGIVPQALPSPTPPPNSVQFNRYPSYGQPRWSPDGKELVVPLSFSPTNSYLVLLSPSGGPAHYLAVDSIDRNLVYWSPSGDTIAYIAANGQELWVWDPYLQERAGSNPERLYQDGSWDTAYGLTWSPDSRQIALMAGKQDASNNIALSLRIFPRFWGTATSIPIDSSASDGRPGFRGSYLSWSPDGQYLAYLSAPNGQGRFGNQLVVIHPDGSGQKVLVEADRGLSSFTWSPDGRWIAFSIGFQIWGASLDAFEKGQVPLVELAPLPGSALSWQKVTNAN